MKGKNKKTNGDGTPHVYDNSNKAKVNTGNIVDDVIESDIELDGDVVNPDNDPPQKMGDPSIPVSIENREAARILEARAAEATSEGKLQEAIEHLTEAILLNPNSDTLYESRASAFLKLNKPNAAIRDIDAALQISPDSAKSYKARGMAKAKLGQWKESAKDLHNASKLDNDDEIHGILQKVESNVHKIEEHGRKYEHMQKNEGTIKVEARYGKKEQTLGSKASDSGSNDSRYLAALQEGDTINIRSSKELKTKLNAATTLCRPTVLYFTAKWCGPCRFMGPLYKTLAEKHHNIVFLKADIDKVGDAAKKWNVSTVPTFFFLMNGEEVDKLVEADKRYLEKKIAALATI